MRILFLIILFLVSCSIKETIIGDKPESSISSNLSKKVDKNHDGVLTQEEFISFKKDKNITSSFVDYQNPLLIFLFILSVILSLCSITYIIDSLKKIFLYIKEKCNK